MNRGIVVWPLVGSAGVCVIVGVATHGAFAAWTAAGAYLGSALWAGLVMPSTKEADKEETQ